MSINHLTPADEVPAAGRRTDERLIRPSVVSRVLRRPELGAIGGFFLVLVFFMLTANSSMFTLSGVMSLMTPASQLGIVAISAALLMIGGEFDLSIGSMVAFAGMFFGACVLYWHMPLSLAIIATLLVAACFGVINAQIVLRTGLPSFIVTLAFLFGLKGATLAGLKMITGTTQMSEVAPLWWTDLGLG